MRTPAPLAIRIRSERVESTHYGHLIVVDPDGRVLLSRGTPEEACYVRSTLKPVQVLPLFLTGAADALALPDEAIAVAVASHSGQDAHLEAVQLLLDRAGLSPEALQCGTHLPYHAPTAEALQAAGQAPGPIHCNCSGKHAAMLATCRHMGWDTETYRAPDHPLQRMIRAELAFLSGVPEAALAHGVDGCGVPVWHLPLAGLARAFARLTSPEGLPPTHRQAAERITQAMTAHPLLVAGEGRLDTDLLAAGSGRLIAKIGGEGVHAGGLLGSRLGWAIKVADGNRRAIAPALARALAALGHPLPQTPALQRHVAPEVFNNRQELVGRLQAGW